MINISIFKKLSIIEGLSLLILLCIAMPIKYIGGNPAPVSYVGMIHGILFILYVVYLLAISSELEWSFRFTFIAFISASIPFGMIYLDKKLKTQSNQKSISS